LASISVIDTDLFVDIDLSMDIDLSFLQ